MRGFESIELYHLTAAQRDKIVIIYWKNGDSSVTMFHGLKGGYDAETQAIGKILNKS